MKTEDKEYILELIKCGERFASFLKRKEFDLTTRRKIAKLLKMVLTDIKTITNKA